MPPPQASVISRRYALSVKDPYVLVSNLPGCVAAMMAIVNMLPLMKGNGGLRSVQTVMVGGTLSNLCLWSYLIFSGVTGAARSKILGLYASAFCVILFGSPLSTITKVVAKRDSASAAPASVRRRRAGRGGAAEICRHLVV